MALRKFTEQQELVSAYLDTAANAKKQADRNLDELRELKSVKDGLKAAFSDGGSSPKEYARYVAVCEEIDRYKGKVLQDNEAYLFVRVEITKQIDRLTDSRYSLILKKRYLDFKGMEIIAAEMNYSQRRLNDLHKAALDDFYKANKNHFIELQLTNAL